MADLFDVNVGGVGFHLTSHIIALAALFIACFAIAGYISFRDNSIDRRKLKFELENEGVINKLVSPSTALGTNDIEIGRLPARSFIKGIQVYTKTLSVGAATTDLDYSIGTSVGGAQVVAAGGATNEFIMRNGTLQGTYNATSDKTGSHTLVGGGSSGLWSDTERTLYIRFAVTDAALTTAGEYVVNVIWGTY